MPNSLYDIYKNNKTAFYVVSGIAVLGTTWLLFNKFGKVSNIDNVFERIFKSEGGYVNNPNDKGGETKYGISKRAFPNVDIKNLTKAQAKDLYKKHYLLKIPIVKNEAWQYQLYDHAINAGVSAALKLHKDTAGSFFPATMAKFKRRSFYEELAKKGNNKGFLKSWLERTNY